MTHDPSQSYSHAGPTKVIITLAHLMDLKQTVKTTSLNRSPRPTRSRHVLKASQLDTENQARIKDLKGAQTTAEQGEQLEKATQDQCRIVSHRGNNPGTRPTTGRSHGKGHSHPVNTMVCPTAVHHNILLHTLVMPLWRKRTHTHTHTHTH